ncbi:MAG: hypothetical protein ACXABO_18925 [Promethearchaeota archaeon]|jgi:ABC-type dipeptide/oligopeptide/nickel transport system permease component
MSVLKNSIKNVKESYDNIKEVYKNIFSTFIIAIITIFIGLELIFLISNLMPGDRVAAHLAATGVHNPSQAQYDAMKHLLGLDLPLFQRFGKFIAELFTGDWGISVSIVRGQSVIDLISERAFLSIGLGTLPIIIGIVLGIIIGKISYRNRGGWKDKVIQLLTVFGLSIPIFFLGMTMQYTLGFEMGLFDPVGQLNFLPLFCITFAVSTVISKQVRSYLVDDSRKKSIISNSIMTGKILGFFLMFIILIESTFGLNGLGRLLLYSIFLYDFYLLNALFFVFLISVVILTLISNLFFTLYRSLENKQIIDKIKLSLKIRFKLSTKRQSVELTDKIRTEDTMKGYLLNRIRSPIVILGLILVLFFIIISISPQLLTEYSLSEVMRHHAGSWNPPSSDHPLGQTVMGGDVLARIIWGIRDSMVFGISAVLIGLIGGCIFGFIAGRFNHWGYKIIIGILMFLYLVPGFILILLIFPIFGPISLFALPIIGFSLIPSFTLVIANSMSGEINLHRIGKSIISHIPLYFGYAVIIYATIGFLGLFQDVAVILGNDINVARENPFDAPWASLFPGLAIFGIVFSFLILHIGLQDHGPRIQRSRIFDMPENQSQLEERKN